MMQVYDSTALWLEGFRAQSTKKSYQVHLRRFCEFHRLTPDDLVKLEAQSIKRLMLEYVVHLRKVAVQRAGKPKRGEISVNSIPMYLAGIYSFLEHHEITVPRKTIERYYPEQVTNSFRPYTRAEIAKLLTDADLREKCIILLMASAGIRVGAFETLRWKHLKSLLSGVGLLTVYGDSKDSRYVTFVTPECLKYLDEYKATRLREGEKLDLNSPIIRNKVAWMSARTNGKVKPLGHNGIRAIILELMKRAGLASEELQPHHAFRKFFNTTVKNAGVDKDFKELFMGHSIQLDDIYYDENDEQSQAKLLSEYMKAVDALTIDEANRLKRKVTDLEHEKTHWERHANKLDAVIEKLEKKGLI